MIENGTISAAFFASGRIVAGGITITAGGFSITPGYECDPGALRMLRVLNGESVEPFRP